MTLNNFTDGASDRVAHAADVAADTLHAAGKGAVRGAESAARSMDAAARRVEKSGNAWAQMITDHPYRSMAGAAVMGVVAGALLLRRR